MTGLQFRAENSHRFPSSSKGWYLYHKSKNYNSMVGGIKEGLKLGSRVAIWAGLFFYFEEIVDQMRAQRDALSTVVAGLTVAGIFSVKSKSSRFFDPVMHHKSDSLLLGRFPLKTAARTTRIGLYSGLAFGLFEDILSLSRGRRLAYVETIRDTVNNATGYTKN